MKRWRLTGVWLNLMLAAERKKALSDDDAVEEDDVPYVDDADTNTHGEDSDESAFEESDDSEFEKPKKTTAKKGAKNPPKKAKAAAKPAAKPTVRVTKKTTVSSVKTPSPATTTSFVNQSRARSSISPSSSSGPNRRVGLSRNAPIRPLSPVRIPPNNNSQI